jgi:hypothetical protein
MSTTVVNTVVSIEHQFEVGQTIQRPTGGVMYKIEGIKLEFVFGSWAAVYVVRNTTSPTSTTEAVKWVDAKFQLRVDPRKVVHVQFATEVYDGYGTYTYHNGQSRSSMLTLQDGTKVFATDPAMVLVGDIIPE